MVSWGRAALCTAKGAVSDFDETLGGGPLAACSPRTTFHQDDELVSPQAAVESASRQGAPWKRMAG